MGPCAKTKVICKIISKEGKEWVGENFCHNPQLKCPREPGEGYEKCKSICKQEGHAEQVAAKLAGMDAVGGTAYLYGHYYACDNCQQALKNIGITEIVLMSPELKPKLAN